jgi:hypothetical protein
MTMRIPSIYSFHDFALALSSSRRFRDALYSLPTPRVSNTASKSDALQHSHHECGTRLAITKNHPAMLFLPHHASKTPGILNSTKNNVKRTDVT